MPNKHMRDLFLYLYGENTYNKIKYIYKSSWKRVYPKMSIDGFRRVLQDELGVNKGSLIFIHSSMSQLNLSFSHLHVLKIIRDIIGENGTIVCPAFPFNNNTDLLKFLKDKDSVFDVARTPSVTGLLPEMLRRSPDAIRSAHPTHSVVAQGPLAKMICEEHYKAIYPCGENSPFTKFAELDGRIIGIGVGVEYLTFVHTTEDILIDDFPEQPMYHDIFSCKVYDASGSCIDVRTKVNYIKEFNPNIKRYMRKYVDESICKEIKTKGNKFFTCNSRMLLRRMTKLANEGVTVYNVQ